MFTLGILCGGPSLERGISLNSARVLLDHVDKNTVNIQAFFVDQKLRYYAIPNAQLYSNTPADFDFKIHQVGQELAEENFISSMQRCDLVFPVIHGSFGEDGKLARLLERYHIPFVGNSSEACKRVYAKDKVYHTLKQEGFHTLTWLRIDNNTSQDELKTFWTTHISDKAVIKPSEGGSSINVHVIESFDALCSTYQQLLTLYDCLVLQPYQHGTEFTILVMHNKDGEAVALPATETVLHNQDAIYDYRTKYLPTNACTLYTPPKLSISDQKKLSNQALTLFKQLNLRDFARFDGYFIPGKGFVCNDINPYSGFEENSFIFKQSTHCGLTHKSLISLIIAQACRRLAITPPKNSEKSSTGKKPVYVLMGGSNAERQVSLMSGRNVWLKLLSSEKYQPTAIFIDPQQQAWQLPYSMFLQHTCEEVVEAITNYASISAEEHELCRAISKSLSVEHKDTNISHMPLDNFLSKVAKENAVVFLALHGGIGEDGTVQKYLASYKIPHNGSKQDASALCMNKYETQRMLAKHPHKGIQIAQQLCIDTSNISSWDTSIAKEYWEQLTKDIPNGPYIIKPRSEGCSSGVVILHSVDDLATYLHLVYKKERVAAPNTFHQQTLPIEMPWQSNLFIIEGFIQTDQVSIAKQQLQYSEKTGWLEFTVVVRVNKNRTEAFTPSLTVSDGAVLSLEEKFQGGTGINLTPPPENIISTEALNRIKEIVCYSAKVLGIEQYARIDLFYHKPTGIIQIIEANTLPGLTPSTVLFQQALTQRPAITPIQFLETLMDECYEEQLAEVTT